MIARRLSLILLLAACEGPMGPPGPRGWPGEPAFMAFHSKEGTFPYNGEAYSVVNCWLQRPGPYPGRLSVSVGEDFLAL